MLCIPFIGPLLAWPFFTAAAIALVSTVPPPPLNIEIAGVLFLIGLL